MNPIQFAALSIAACAIAHFSVVFLEPLKASWHKASVLGIFLVLGSNVARWSGFNVAPLMQWFIYIIVAGGFVWSLYKLKPLNSFTVGASYVAGSYVLAHAFQINTITFVV